MRGTSYVRRSGSHLDAIHLAQISYANFIGYLGLVLAPAWVAALGRLASSDRLAGLVATGQFVAFGLASLATAAAMRRLPPERLLLLGIGLAALGDLVCWVGARVDIIVAGRIVAGLGQGIVLSSANRLAAATSSPHRSFAVMTFVLTGMGAVCFLLIPTARDHLGSHGVFGLMLMLDLVALAALPRAQRQLADQSAMEHPSVSVGRSILPLLAYSFFCMGQISLWSFLERIGEQMDLTIREITTVLAAGGVVSLLGPLVAGLLADTGPKVTAAALSATAASVLLFHLPNPLLAFAAGDFIFNLLGQFCIVQFLAAFAKIDATGRTVAASPGFMSLGIALGPVIGGMAMTYGSSAVFAVAAALHLIAAVMVLAFPRSRTTLPT